jgi:hypothetical protein
MVTRGQRIKEPPLPIERTLALTYLGLVLTTVYVQADLSRCLMCKVLRAVESPLRGYNDLQDGFEELWSIVAPGQERNKRLSCVYVRGASRSH